MLETREESYMSILNNFRYNIIDVAISDSTNIVHEIIHRLQIIQGYQSIGNDVFIELCNEMRHIELNFVNQGWTIGQKRAFLKTIEPFIQQVQDTYGISFTSVLDISSAQEEQLDTSIALLKTTLLEYIKKCENESAEKHAALMGEKVAQELKDINEILTAPETSPQQKKEAISAIFTNLASYTRLHESWHHKVRIIDAFLVSFQQHYDHNPLIGLLKASSGNRNGYNNNYDVLKKAVLEAARNKIEDIVAGLIDQCALDQTERRKTIDEEQLLSLLSMYFTEAIEKEEVGRQNIAQEMQNAFNSLKQDLDENIQKLLKKQESIFEATKSAYREYDDQIKQYSGKAEETPLLKSKKEQIEQLVQQLSSQTIQQIAQEFSIPERSFKDHSTAINYLADLEQNCLLNYQKVKDQAVNLHASMLRVFETDKHIKDSIKSGDISVVSEGIRILTNDIPHEIQKIIIPETNKHITLGSSRFF